MSTKPQGRRAICSTRRPRSHRSGRKPRVQIAGICRARTKSLPGRLRARSDSQRRQATQAQKCRRETAGLSKQSARYEIPLHLQEAGDKRIIAAKAVQPTENPPLTLRGPDSDPASSAPLSLRAIGEASAQCHRGHAAYPVGKCLTNGIAAPGRFPAESQSRTGR